MIIPVPCPQQGTLGLQQLPGCRSIQLPPTIERPVELLGRFIKHAINPCVVEPARLLQQTGIGRQNGPNVLAKFVSCRLTELNLAGHIGFERQVVKFAVDHLFDRLPER